MRAQAFLTCQTCAQAYARACVTRVVRVCCVRAWGSLEKFFFVGSFNADKGFMRLSKFICKFFLTSCSGVVGCLQRSEQVLSQTHSTGSMRRVSLEPARSQARLAPVITKGGTMARIKTDAQREAQDILLAGARKCREGHEGLSADVQKAIGEYMGLLEEFFGTDYEYPYEGQTHGVAHFEE